jgi:DNA repair protein RadD
LLNAKACTLFLVHRRELLHQAVAKLSVFGIEAGTILAGEPTDPTAHTQVAAVQTLTARTRRGSMQFPPADLVVLDECHHATAPTWRAVIARYPKAIILGVTATPCRSDGRGLGGIFEEMICPQVAELIDNKHLVPTRVYAPNVPDLKGVHTKAGDYALDELAERMDRIGLIGDIVTHWHRLAERRSTVIFATSVAHSIHICEALAESGVKAAHIDGKTPKDERD